MAKRFSRERIFYILMTVLIAGVIFFASTIQTTAGEGLGFNFAAFYHFGIFFMFTFFLSLSIRSGKINLKTAAIIILLSLAYAISDEFHQLFIIGRFASGRDVLIDFTGILFSLLVVKDTEFFNKK
jgi:hypothetical protein